MRANLVALLLLTTGCTHTITVLAPASQVPAGTHVTAAITPGEVKQLPHDAVMGEGLVVTQDKNVLAHLAPTDTIALEASNGDDIGNIHVHRAVGYDVAMIGGVLLMLGGVTGSLVGAGQCNVNSFSLSAGCAAIGFAGSAVSLAGGTLLVIYGSHGSLSVTTSGVAGTF